MHSEEDGKNWKMNNFNNECLIDIIIPSIQLDDNFGYAKICAPFINELLDFTLNTIEIKADVKKSESGRRNFI